MYEDKNSSEIQQLVKDYEAAPLIKYDIKETLQKKEAELIKKRNCDLFATKTFEKQLDALRKALKVL